MVLCQRECTAAAVYTQNKVQGAPITITRENISNGRAWGILVNSGNANTCNPDGLDVARKCCALAAQATGLRPEDFVLASTGVIGQALPIEPFAEGIPALVPALSEGGSTLAARAIMTTDTVEKEFAVEFTVEGTRCRLGAIGKGSGMIDPNMATMLVFLTTDANIAPDMLQQALRREVAGTLNQICIDGDMSTNDTTAILASGMAGNAPIIGEGEAFDVFCAALREVLVRMARALAADGEGATKLLECRVSGAPDESLARAIAKSVISSDLVKAAMFGEDANWGRVLCAIGYAPGAFSVEHVSVAMQSAAGQVQVCKDAAHLPYSEEQAALVLAQDVIEILVDLGQGEASGIAWGCDLSYDYVKINGDYRT
ncbi:arginine biosynthesis bifunctional protein ArgJ [Bacteroidia bacterium]|nr:arginine biosynthesis bifunctional protein ArgJ [Bacteroidia bacterium]